jgi:7,8-dihydropterin-6-yl-methyl-4-(beta-D-ribofuranosyl)aminobenzene 5'-phosphate synthase
LNIKNDGRRACVAGADAYARLTSGLKAVDRVEVHVLVETEFAGLTRRRGASWVLAGNCLCCAAHGLACLVTVTHGRERRTLLFDSGPEDRTFEQNVSRLGVDLGGVEAIVLSHGHWDHGGAMLRALQLIRDRNGGAEIPYYAYPDMFRTRATRLAGDKMRLMEDVPSVEALTGHGARVVNTPGGARSTRLLRRSTITRSRHSRSASA